MSQVIKRDGRIEKFDEARIEVAIKKAFESEKVDYTNSLIHQLADKVTFKILTDVTNVEVIQDSVVNILNDSGYESVAKCYEHYRKERTRVRESKNSLMKTIGDITFADSKDVDLKRENANIDGNTSMGAMLRYGSESAKQYNLNKLIKKNQADAHINGDIHIHDLDFYALTTTCTQIDLIKLFKDGFSTGHGHLREPKSIGSYAALAAIAIQSNQNDQHGGQSIVNFDYAMAKGVRLTYEKHIKELQELIGEIKIDCDIEEHAMKLTRRDTYQAMEGFIHNLNTMHSRAGAQVPFSSINYGMDTSWEGRLAIEQLLLATEAGLGNGETPIFPIQIFRVKEGINFNLGEPNYDLFKLAIECSAKRMFPNFSFQDAPFNLQYYKEGHPETEIAYMGCRTRVMANAHDKTKEVSNGRGNLSFTSINLPRIAIQSNKNLDSFYNILEMRMNLVAEQLLDRFKIQCKRRVKNYPFLMGQGVWIDSEKLKPNDELTSVLKNGTLSIGFIGLAETLKFLTGYHHGESSDSQKLGLEIIKYMRDYCDNLTKKTKLNFTLLATPAEGLSGRFIALDKKKFGIIEGVTDRDYYTNSFHVPVYYKISVAKKIEIEAPYHALTNAGHISYVELDGDMSNNLEAFESIIRYMKVCGIGYGSINHPIDRDPTCGYNGVIKDECPNCHRKETVDEPFERIRRITGYLVGSLEHFNNAKRSEEADRVKHNI